jgi:hypothetical protein
VALPRRACDKRWRRQSESGMGSTWPMSIGERATPIGSLHDLPPLSSLTGFFRIVLQPANHVFVKMLLRHGQFNPVLLVFVTST